MDEVADKRAAGIRENPVLQLASVVLAVLSLLAATVPAVGLALAIAAAILGLLIPPRRGYVRVITIVIVALALAVNVAALVLAVPIVTTVPEMQIQPV